MELFKTVADGEEYWYLLDGINENFGVFDLTPDNSLVAMFKPANRVQAVRLDGHVRDREVRDKFNLTEAQGKAFAEILNHHIPNSPGVKSV